MPRPSKNLTRRVTIRLTPEEFAQLQRDADTAAVDLSTIARAQIINAPMPRRARRRSADHTAFSQAMGLFGRHASNLNQMMKLAHRVGDFSHYRDSAAMLKELFSLSGMLRQAMMP